MDSRFWVIAVVAAASLLALAVPAGAELTWSGPAAVTAEAGVGGYRVAMDARGNVLVVWERHYGDGTPTWQGNKVASSYRWYRPGEGWGPVRDLPRSAGFIADFAITPRGEAHALVLGTGAERVPAGIWTAAPGERLEAEAGLADGVFAGARAALGIDDAGDDIVAWTSTAEPNRPLNVSIRPAGGSFGNPQKVGEYPSGNLDVVMNPAGAAAVAWVDGDGRPRVAYRPAGGQFGPAEDPGVGASARGRVGIDHEGRVIAAGRYHDGTGWTPGSGPTQAAVAVRSPLGGWSDQQVVSEDAWVGDILVEPGGAAILVASRRTEGASSSQTVIITRHPDGRIQEEELGTGLASPAATLNHRGTALVAWAPSTENPEPNVFVRERPPGAAAFGARAVIDTGITPVVSDVALNDLGQAVLVWYELRRVGDRWEYGRAMANVRDDPALRDEPAPPHVTIYKDPLASLDDDGDLRAPVRCDQSCKVSSAGIVFPGGGRQAVAGRGKTVRLKARRKSRVKLDFGAEGARAVREALAAGARPWVSVTVSGRGRSPRPLVVTRRYKLRR